MRAHPVILLGLAFVSFGGSGCGKDPSMNAPDPTVTSLTISSVFAPTALGQSSQFTALTVMSDHSSRVVSTGVQWTSSNPAAMTVSATGLVTAVGFGTATITASFQTFTATKQLSLLPAVMSVLMTGSTTFNDVGQTSQLNVTATLTDGSTQNVTGLATWQSRDPGVATVTPQGLVRAVGLGYTTITMFYGAHSNDREQRATVTPAGTFIASGIVRHPGHGPLTGGTLVDTLSGRSAVPSNLAFARVVPGLNGTANLTFTKDGYEPASVSVSGAPDAVTEFDLPVQPVIRVTVGQSATMTIAPNDLSYNTPTVHCTRCLLIRLVSSGSATAHLTFTWNRPGITITAWIAGQSFTASGPGPLEFDVPVNAGETVFYAGASAGTINPSDVVTVTLTSAVNSAEEPTRRGPH